MYVCVYKMFIKHISKRMFKISLILNIKIIWKIYQLFGEHNNLQLQLNNTDFIQNADIIVSL